MSLDKSINHNKEYRKQYRGAKSIDKQCRNHGNCIWCLENRMHKYDVQVQKANYKEE